MKVINKIRAFFTLRGKQKQMELAAAEIRWNGVYLHPAEDLGHTYFVKTDEVDIIIKPGAEITEEDILIRSHVVNVDPEDPACEIPSDEQIPPEFDPRFEDIPPEEPPVGGEDAPKRLTPHAPANEYVVGGGWKKPKKKSFTVMLYPDEYDRLVQVITEKGYKKVEYILACVESAKKTSMEANYKRFTEERKRRRKEETQEAKKAREAENQTKQAENEEVNE